MTLPEQKSRFYVPSSIRLLLSPGVRGHTLIFTTLMAFLFATAYVGATLGFAQAWTIIFIAGASTTGVYLVLTPFALLEKFRSPILFSRMTRRVIILVIAYAPMIAGIAYWIQQAGSVEALPIFPAFIIIFYTWILLQAYFIATPVSQLLVKVERGLTGEGNARKLMRTLGISTLFLPIAPLTYGTWAISNWLSATYRNVQGATDKIIIWTMIVTVLLLATYFFTALWGWRVIVQKKPQAAVFAGGTFLVLWGYLLYRATTIAIGYITQDQPSNPLADSGLMIISVIGAMQTFARKTANHPDRRLSRILPFLVFAFGSVYAVAQFYFILRVPITRIDLSIIVNATVFAAGIFTMMFLIRRHLVAVELNAYKAKMAGQNPNEPSGETTRPHRSLFRLPWKKAAGAPEPQLEQRTDETPQNESVPEQNESVAEPDDTVAQPAEEGTDPDQDY
ncbi:MAG TPA: hypothetical protein VGS11_01110 [Candidatus Bathyarchaeia archaeon]|nr:hypothetical protein [Candidatus Bathyarchaeia archaeon]